MRPEAPQTVVVVGGGFSGAVLAMKLARVRPQDSVHLIERRRRAGVGLAYGACSPLHLLNVPVSRMESGLSPSFADWLGGRPDLEAALAESGGVLADAFVPRALFGQYVEERLAATLSPDPERGLHRLRGEAVRLAEAPHRGVVLEDGREIKADLVILATGNMAPSLPAVFGGDAALATDRIVPDPWAGDAFEGLGRDEPVLLVGAGLTMADVVLLLDQQGHRGPLTAVSRHGWTPTRHAPGGSWAPFLDKAAPKTPLAALRIVRRELVRAEAAGVPWQRVFDAARPDLARIWSRWDLKARRRFLRHLRTRWDIRRHRMAPRIANALDRLLAEGRLTVLAGRIASTVLADQGAMVRVALRSGETGTLGPVSRIVNCTGPRSDFDRLEAPLFGQLRRRGLIRPDDLALGIETDHCAVLDARGAPSAWLYAIGPLTRPALWEVTAVPEINAQIDALVRRLAEDVPAEPASPYGLDLAFADLGAGI